LIACGPKHALVVVADGGVFTWGAGAHGRLGHGDGVSRVAPTRVAFFPRRDATVRHVACGLHHTLAVAWEPKAGAYDAPGDAIALTARLYAWGFGDGGRLGTGEVSGACRFPARVLLPVEYGYDAADDAPRPHVVAAAAGDQHSLALLTDGRVFAWGSNAFGQLGLGRASAQAVPLPERVGGAGRRGKVVKIAAGARHSGCVSEDGAVLLWGFGDEGQLGAG
ncbi:hypothetical protein AURANDRAFT_5485, partial [Aureococcus anophagefferens]